jgi:hypothetical protein
VDISAYTRKCLREDEEFILYRAGIGLSGDRVLWLKEHSTFAVSGIPLTARENSGEGIIFTPVRTHNRSRRGGR